jgi:type I restriction enzyme S subunit
MSEPWPLVPLGEGLKHRKEFIRIDDLETYKRCRVQLHAQGIVLRDSVTGAEIKTKTQQVCRRGEFLVAEIDAKVGGFGIVPDDLDGAIVSSHYFLFGIDGTKLDRRFLDYYIRTPAFREQVEAQGSTNYAAIRPADVLRYTVPLPPLAEQGRIVGRIEALAERIGEAATIRGLAIEEAESIVRASLNGHEDALKANGKTATLAGVIESNDSGWSPQCDDEPARPGEWGVLKTTSVQSLRFVPSQNKALRSGQVPRPEIEVGIGDVLITRAGPVNRVGVACCVTKDVTRLMLSDKIVRLKPNSSVVPQFLAIALSTPGAQEFFRHGKTGLADSQVNIPRSKLLEAPLHSLNRGSAPHRRRTRRPASEGGCPARPAIGDGRRTRRPAASDSGSGIRRRNLTSLDKMSASSVRSRR